MRAGLALPPTYPWTGRGQVRGVPRAWGREGWTNAVGHLGWDPKGQAPVGFRVLEGPCRTGEVVAYLEALAWEAQGSGRPTVVFLDNVPFHHLNPMETVWRRVRGFLLPRWQNSGRPSHKPCVPWGEMGTRSYARALNPDVGPVAGPPLDGAADGVGPAEGGLGPLGEGLQHPV